jgi:Ca2+-binding EF-hand superfamily protein
MTAFVILHLCREHPLWRSGDPAAKMSLFAQRKGVLSRSERRQSSLCAKLCGLALVLGCGRAPSAPPVIAPASAALPSDAVSSKVAQAEQPLATQVEKAAAEKLAASADQEPDASDGAAADTVADPSLAETFILFLPAGPLIVRLNMTIDGRPFHAAREELIDEVLAVADADHDGRPTWKEIIADSKTSLTRRFDLSLDLKDRKEFLRTHDTNQNGLLDRDEARRLVARAASSGEAFSLTSTTKYRNTNQRHSLIRGALDADADGLLSPEELAAADTRLLARDANGDAIVTWEEIDDTLAGDAREAMGRGTTYLDPPAALALDDRADWDAIVYAFSELYLSGDEPAEAAFSLDPSLPGRLDADGDGHFSFEEVRGLESLTPHLVLAVNFGTSGDLAAGVSLTSASPELGPAGLSPAYSSHGLTLDLGGYRVRFAIDDRGPIAAAPDATTEARFAMLDADKNGYLEAKEVADTPDSGTFADWDADEDGKVFLKEFAAYARGRQAPRLSAIQARVGDDHDVLFPLLDMNQDGRLTPRELRRCGEQLLPLDRDGDGRIDVDELPGSISVVLGRGLPAPMAMSATATAMAPVAAPPPSIGPSWFAHLDANHDEEVSAEEFPGSRAKFDQLDIDRDGFVTISEAQSAAAAKAED